MIIAISGTPGTGKTVVARELVHLLHFTCVSITALVKAGKIPNTQDPDRDTNIVSVGAVKKAVATVLKHNHDAIVEGHLSHFVPADVVFILRTNPHELKARLKKKGWSAKKIQENVQAEILDATTIETLEIRRKHVYEIDTSDKKPKETADVIYNILNNLCRKKAYSVGHIRWLPEYQQELLR